MQYEYRPRDLDQTDPDLSDTASREPEYTNHQHNEHRDGDRGDDLALARVFQPIPTATRVIPGSLCCVDLRVDGNGLILGQGLSQVQRREIELTRPLRSLGLERRFRAGRPHGFPRWRLGCHVIEYD
jgi:hypothetical protein